MPRSTVVLNMFSSIDGRITTGPGLNVGEWKAAGIDGSADYESHRLFDQLDCDGIISGSETLLVWSGHPIADETPSYTPRKSRAFIVFDGRGRMNWAYTQGLVVVTREDVDGAYLAQLREKQVDFIQAGRGQQIDLQAALEALYERGFRRLGLSGGGKINGAFLRAGLIDEISLVLAPLAVGGTATPTLFDGPDLTSAEGLTRLDLLQARPLGQGAFWLHYRVQ